MEEAREYSAIDSWSGRDNGGLNMRKFGQLLALGGVMAMPVAAQDAVPVATPSGVEVSLQEWLLDTQPTGEVFARFRFVAPEIDRAKGRFTLVDLEADFQVLCEEFALINVAAQPAAVDRIVISLADRQVEFGYADPEATQYFEAFRVENATCIWEFF